MRIMKPAIFIVAFLAIKGLVFSGETVSGGHFNLFFKDGKAVCSNSHPLEFENSTAIIRKDKAQFDDKSKVVLKLKKNLQLGSDFIILAKIKISENQNPGYQRILSQESLNPRGGFALAIKDGKLCLWSSRKSWLHSDLKVADGKWHKIGAICHNNRLFLFCDSNLSTEFDFDKAPIIKSSKPIVIGGNFKGEIAQLKIAPKAIGWEMTQANAKDWILPEKYTRDNGFRGKTVLNAFWGRRKEGDTRNYIKYRTPEPQARNPKEVYEYYREFSIPPKWRGRNLFLEIGGFATQAAVFIDGKEIIRIPRNRHYIKLPLPNKTDKNPYQLKIETGAIYDDIYLLSRPKTNENIEETFMITSFREKAAKVKLCGCGNPGGKYFPEVKIYEDANCKNLVKTICSEKPVASFNGKWQAELFSPWDSPSLWSLWHPNLYYYTVELKNEAGEIKDKTLPRPFGFREVWIENGRFILNGNPVTVVGEAWESAIGYENVMREPIKKYLLNLKKMGITGGFRVRSDQIFELGDEVGMLFQPEIGSVVKLNIWDPKSGLTAMGGDENLEEISRRVKRWREHPSILLWSSNTSYSLNTMHPLFAGQNSLPWNFFPANRNVARAKKAQLMFKKLVDMVAELDPTRVVGTSSSPFSPVEGTTRYLCDNLDVQEREEFFDYWFRSDRPKAIWVHEFGTPFQGHFYLRRIDHQMPHTGLWPKILLENAARQFGEKSYLLESDKELAHWGKRSYNEDITCKAMQKVMTENMYRIWRSWRTYGINASAHHLLNSHGFLKTKISDNERYGIIESDPRRPGLSKFVPRHWFPMLGIDKMLPAGEAYLKAVNPLLAYIGGADSNFNNKDHLYYSGAMVKKAAIVVNDWDQNAKLNGIWELLNENGKTMAKGNLKGDVKSGRRALTEFPIEFRAPAVDKRTDFTIRIKMSANLPGSLEDAFPITVFPEHKTPNIKFKGNIWRLNISDDCTHETKHFIWNKENLDLLKGAGIKSKLIKGLKTFNYMGYSPKAALALYKSRKPVQEGTPQAGDLLIIPRNTLRSMRDDRQLCQRLLKNINLDKLINSGLRVIVFEQAMDNILGLQTEDVRPRRAFISAKGHPVFKGLKESDMTNWTGQSDLEPAMGRIAPSDWEYPDRLWHVSNTNSVATRTIIRPQTGSARALLVSGFDLGESPLLEVSKGRGRIIFCTLDATNRYGKDPVATRLVDNIFEYITNVKEPDPGKSSTLLLKPDGKNVILEKNVFRAAKPKGKDGWGITRGELFFRESIYNNNWITKNLPEKELPVLAGKDQKLPCGIKLPEVIRFNPKIQRFEMTLSENDFNTGWGKRKISWLKSALVVNQGGSCNDGPGICLQGNQTALYPYVWVEGFVHPYTSDIW